MSTFRARIAGLRVDLVLGGPPPRGLDRWRPFACAEGPPDVAIELEPGALEGVAGITGRVVTDGPVWRSGGAEHLGWLDPATGRGVARSGAFVVSAEVLARAALARSVARRGGVLLHAAAIQVDGRAHLVPGRSGAGKSTLAGLAGHVLTDELAVVFPGGQGEPAVVHGTPWWSSAGGAAPLARVYTLAWGAPAVTPLHGPGLLRQLAQGLVLPFDDPAEKERAFALCGALAGTAPFARLTFQPDTDVDALLRAHAVRRAA